MKGTALKEPALKEPASKDTAAKDTRVKRFLLFGTIALVFLVADQLTKIWAADRLGHSCPTLMKTGELAPEVTRCNDEAPSVRLPKAVNKLEVSTTKGERLSWGCAAGEACLSGELRLDKAPAKATASGAWKTLVPGTVSSAAATLGAETGTLRFGYEKGSPPMVLIKGYFAFEYAENKGAAWSFLADKPGIREPVLISVACLAVLLLLWWVYRLEPGQRMLAVALGLLFSGAVGNLIDRIRLGYVIDFILFHIKDGFRWPNFNVADIAIVVGVGLLAIDSIAAWRRERREKKAGSKGRA